jgi:hypothetical protein
MSTLASKSGRFMTIPRRFGAHRFAPSLYIIT